MLVFLAIMKMGHCKRDQLTKYWSRAYNYHTTFYGNCMKWDRFFHILRYLHFTDNKNEPDMTDENSDRLWKIRNLFEILNKKFSKFYNPSEHLAVDKVIVKYQGRVIFQQHIPKKHKCFGIKIYQLCDETGYTYDMTVLSGQRQTVHCATPDCNSRDSIGIDKESTRMWPKTVYGQLLLLSQLIR